MIKFSVSNDSKSPEIRKKWRDTIVKVSTLLKVTNCFHTLRDRQHVVIPKEHLQIVKKYGSGQFGTVVKCIYKGNFVAVKLLKEQFVNTEDQTLFLNEMRILRKVRHPNIINYIGAGYEIIDGYKRPYIVQEAIEGGCLHSLLVKQCLNQSSDIYNIMDAFNWSFDIAKGMKYLHASHPMVVHRDLKLQNIMLVPQPKRTKAVIVDFGLHKLITKMETDVYHLTGQAGSFSYMAPEVFLEKPYNEKVDVYSFGVIVWELFAQCLTALKAFHSGTSEDVEKYAQDVAEGFRQPIPKTWPKKLQNLVEICWDQDPKIRPSFDAICQQLLQMQPEIFAWYKRCVNKYGCCTIQ